ncbi:MAG: rhomboid family intramembrane serine protease [Myxococcota bacterium]|nr:rhomboid family intramembrane serine protease [Myxococcota bacterium]
MSNEEDVLHQAIAGGALSRDHLFREPWRVVCAPLLHLHAVHLTTNLLFCGLLGIVCSVNRSARSTLSIFFMSGWFATVAGVLMQPGWFLGASGAMFGLLGATISANRHTLAGQRLLFVSAVSVLLSVLSKGDPIAHIAGLSSGAVLGRFDVYKRDLVSNSTLMIALVGMGAGLFRLM